MGKDNKSNSLAKNRKAYHEYFIDEVFETGIALVGTEVKSIRGGKANLKDSYAQVKNGEVFVCNMHVSPYEKGNIFNKDPLRERKLLLHKKEIDTLLGYTAQKGFTLIPLSLYLKKGRVKLALGVARGKKNYDKRDAIAEKSAKRDMDRQMKERYR